MPLSVSADKLMKRARRSNIRVPSSFSSPLVSLNLYHLKDIKRYRYYIIQHLLHKENGNVVCECLQGAAIGSTGGITHCSQWEDPITTYVHCLSFSHAV